MSVEGNAKRLAEIERRMSATTLAPPPWTAHPDGSVWRGSACLLQHAERYPYVGAEAEFAAHARSDIPWLVARVKQLEAIFLTLAPADGIVMREMSRDPIEEED